MRIDLLTLFPEFFRSPLAESMLQQAQMWGAVEFRVLNLRDYTLGRHQVADYRPYGGGPGMVMLMAPLVAAIRAARQEDPQVCILLLSPQGTLFTQDKAGELAALPHLLLICGHYEGVDERVKYYIDGMLSIGDYILTGGEIPALAVLDAVTRLLPGCWEALVPPQMIHFRPGCWNIPITPGPGDFEGHRVPQVLLEGDHRRIRVAAAAGPAPHPGPHGRTSWPRRPWRRKIESLSKPWPKRRKKTGENYGTG